MNMSLTLSGQKVLAGKLDRMDDVSRGQTMLRAVHAGVLPILNDAKAHAPVDTGTYRRSLHAGEENVGAHQASVKIGSNVVYGPRLEFGFIGTDSLGRTYHQAARPHLRPALESGRPGAEHEITASLQILIREAVG